MNLAALFRDMPIRRKLTLIAVLSVGAALLFAALVSMVYQWFLLRTELVKTTHSQASIVAANSTSALLFNDKNAANQTLEALGAFDNIEFAMLHDEQGKPFAQFVPATKKPPPLDHPSQAQEHLFTATYLDVFKPIVFEGERIGTIHVRSSLTPIYRQMVWSAVVVAAAAVGGLGLALLLVAYLHPAITGPIARLVGLMDVISSEKNYALRADSQGKDELGALAREFNDMLAQVQARDEALAQHRAHLELEVAQRTASLNEAQHIAHLGSWEWDIVKDTISWSDEIYRIFGLTPQQFDATYEAFMRFVHPDDRNLVDEGVRQALEEGQVFSQDHRIRLPDGAVRHVHEQGEVSLGEDGRATRMVGTVQDITAYKQMELRTLESEKRFRNLAESTSDWIWQVDEYGTYVYSSAKVHDLLGYEPDEVSGKTPFDFMPPEEAARVGEIFKNLISDRRPFSFLENVNLHKDGHRIVLETSGVPLMSDDGTFHGYFGVERDITERKRAEEETQRRSAMVARLNSVLSELAENKRIYGGELDLAFGAITEASASALDVARVSIWFYTESEAGIECRDLYEKGSGVHSRGIVLKACDFPDYFQAMRDEQFIAAHDAVSDRRTREFAEPYLKPLGIASMIDVPIRVGGKAVGVVCHEHVGPPRIWSIEEQSFVNAIGGFTSMAIEASERKRAEEAIRVLNEELEHRVEERTQQLLAAQEELVRKEKLAVLGQVAGSVGHELRNPLGVMNNAVYFLQTVLSDADETTREYLKIIKDEIDDSERIVSDLLDSVRTKPPRPETVGVEVLIGQTLRKCVIPATVTVKLDIPDALSPLQVDVQQIHQVFRNLISNGVEAMPEGGELEIRAVENKPQGQVVISVRDTGAGIAPDILPRLFQPLFTTKSRGIGLGLVVVKNLTEANGGTIAVQSEPGRGTTFTVTLPAARSIVGEG